MRLMIQHTSLSLSLEMIEKAAFSFHKIVRTTLDKFACLAKEGKQIILIVWYLSDQLVYVKLLQCWILFIRNGIDSIIFIPT